MGQYEDFVEYNKKHGILIDENELGEYEVGQYEDQTCTATGATKISAENDDCVPTYPSIPTFDLPDIDLYQQSDCLEKLMQSTNGIIEASKGAIEYYGSISTKIEQLLSYAWRVMIYSVMTINRNYDYSIDIRKYLDKINIPEYDGSLPEYEMVESMISTIYDKLSNHEPRNTRKNQVVRAILNGHLNTQLSNIKLNKKWNFEYGNKPSKFSMETYTIPSGTLEEINDYKINVLLAGMVGYLEVAYDIASGFRNKIGSLGKVKTAIEDLGDLVNEITDQLLLADPSVLTSKIENAIDDIGCGTNESGYDAPMNINHRDPYTNGYPVDSIGYWRKFSDLLTTVNLIPAYWTTGIIVPSPGGPVPVKLPIVWRAVSVVYSPPVLNVVFITVNGVVIFPVVWQWRMKPTGNNDSYFLSLFRGANVLIKNDTGSEANVDYSAGIDPNPNLSLSSIFTKDDIPVWERLSIDNQLLLVYLNTMIRKCIPYMGLPL